MKLKKRGLAGYAPNVSWLFPELSFAERPAAAAAAGFQAIEFGFPSHADLDALKQARSEFGLEIVLFNQDVPVWDRQNRGYLVDPARRDEFDRTFQQALQIADLLDVSKVMLPAGVELDELDQQTQIECMLTNLQRAAPQAADAGVLLTIEMLNPQDNPGYFLTSSQVGLSIVRQLNHPSVRFQFDVYHIGLMEDELEQNLVENMAWIGHIQFADVPGRHEPGTGELNFHSLLHSLVDAGYDDFIGLEYVPQAGGAAALAWCQQGPLAAEHFQSTSQHPQGSS